MNLPKITVYIPSHNYGRFLEQAIESVLLQTMDEWELLVIDDNSSDNTPDVMKYYQGDERIRLFSTSGIGLPSVCNLALKEARGQYIIRLDGDDIFDENILLVLGNYLKRNKDCSMVFPDFYYIDENGNIFAHERREKVYETNHVMDLPANGACSLIQKSVLEKIGGYREDLGAQDGYDLWNKLTGTYKLANINLPLFYYRRHKKNLTNRSHHIMSAHRRIKSDNAKEKSNKYRPITAVIPCRKNYDFCPDVWNQKLVEKKLLESCIEKCTKSDLFDHIVVASDTPDVKDIMSNFTDPRVSYFQRKTQETIRSIRLIPTLERLTAPLDPEGTGVTVIAYLQSPFVTTETLEEAAYTLILNDADCAFGVEEVRVPLFKKMEYGLRQLNPPKGFSTDFDTVYQESNTNEGSCIYYY